MIFGKFKYAFLPHPGSSRNPRVAPNPLTGDGRGSVQEPRSPALREAGAKTVLLEVGPPTAAPFDYVEAKLGIPAPRPGDVSRTGLVNRLRVTSSRPVAALVAPAGYGKTTLLAQWAHRDRRRFAWVSVDERDNDPLTLLRHLAVALDRIEPLGAAVMEALAEPEEPAWTAAVPRLASAVAALSCRSVIVLDDAHILRRGDSSKAIVAVAEHVPAGSMLVLAGRTEPQMPIAALRAEGRLLEIGAAELALTPHDAHLLLRAAGADVTEDEAGRLAERTEGWPAGLALAALSLRDLNGDRYELTGDDRYVSEYFRSEYLSRLSRPRLTFLRRTSVLEKMSGPLCDAVLEATDTASELESLASQLLVTLDSQGSWYRYHRLFRELLRSELDKHEPNLAPELHRRAADWFEVHGEPESELEHAGAAGDTARVARIIVSIALPAYSRGRAAAVEGWLEQFDDDALLAGYPAVAAQGAWIHALRGRAPEADRWLAAAEGSDADGPAAVTRAAMCKAGVRRMLADAEAALAALPENSHWRPLALLLAGIALLLSEENDRAVRFLRDAAGEAERLGLTETLVVALAERSLLAEAEGDQAEGRHLALLTRDHLEKLDGYPTTSIALAVSARALLQKGRYDEARSYLAKACALTPLLTAAPWLAVQARLELARVHLTLRDDGAARGLLSEAGAILRTQPDLGTLAAQATDLRRELRKIPEHGNGKSGLTRAELRLLPLLATHLSFREIGERLFVSRNTIKTQAISTYRKLGVSSRSDAIDRAAELGLVDETSTGSARRFIHSG
jgi:LuxR family transcriptional regulator, maltose regulon positive regulatory protein